MVATLAAVVPAEKTEEAELGPAADSDGSSLLTTGLTHTAGSYHSPVSTKARNQWLGTLLDSHAIGGEGLLTSRVPTGSRCSHTRQTWAADQEFAIGS